MSRGESFQRVAAAIEGRDFTGVSEDDLAVADNDHANKLHRQWIAGGRQPLPLHDDDEADDAVNEILVRIGSRALSHDGRRRRLTIESDGDLKLFAGDAVFIRRATPLRDPERR